MAVVSDRSSRSTPAVTLRPVSPADEELLLTWANDPVTRVASRNRTPIDPGDHHRWLERMLAAPADARLWIGEAEDRPIGVVRFERRTPTAVEIGITVAPDARGQGLARPLLDRGVAAAREVFGQVTIMADVLPNNAASLALFMGAGFTRLAPPPDMPPGEPGVVSLALR